MKLERRGITRLVILTRNYAIKIPNFTCQWNHFLLGLIANMKERDSWRAAESVIEDLSFDAQVKGIRYFGTYNKLSDLLCPVVWASWGGWLLIMKKADVETHIKEVDQRIAEGKPPYVYPYWANTYYDGDLKPDNFGFYDGRLVKIDY